MYTLNMYNHSGAVEEGVDPNHITVRGGGTGDFVGEMEAATSPKVHHKPHH